MNVFVFLLLFTMPSFGGPVTATFEVPTTLDRCVAVQYTVMRKLNENGMKKYELVECHQTTPAVPRSGVFVFTLLIEDTKAAVEFQTLDGCQRIQKVVLRQLEKNNVTEYELVECR